MVLNLMCGDAIEEISNLPGDSIDLVITDPPYHMPSHTTGGGRKNPYRRTLADMSIFKFFLDSLFASLDVVLKPSASAYMFCDARSYPFIYMAMHPYFRHVRTVIWDRITSYNGYTWRRGHEIIAWGEGEDAEQIPTGDSDVIRCRAVPQKNRIHPAQKPVEIIDKIVSKHENAKSILDPFMGSGTVGVACLNNRRRFTGIELDEHYFDIAAQRIANPTVQVRKQKKRIDTPALFGGNYE